MKALCKYIGGSHLYGLDTPESDVDERGVFMNTDPLYIYGFNKLDSISKVSTEEDVTMYELTQFLRLATRSNTQILECLFAPRGAFTQLEPDFEEWVLDKKEHFLNTYQLFKSLEGYIYNEMRLALGERTGLLGSKRKASLETYGFSPKNFSHLFRLAECGTHFFKTGVYPVKLSDFNPAMHDLCMDIKVNPSKFDKRNLQSDALLQKEKMREAYESMDPRQKYVPDLEYAGLVLKYFYSQL